MTTFGPEIAVDGRPAWLGDDDMTTGRKRPYSPSGNWPDPELGWKRAADVEKWENVRAFRLPADHFAYLAIDKGFEPWGGGNAAPVDWDGDVRAIILRNGEVDHNYADYWDHKGDSYDIIGYRKRAVAGPVPNSITLPRMTEAEARKRFCLSDAGSDEGAWAILRHLNLIRPESRAERFTRETRIVVTGDIETALNWERQ